MAGLVAGKLGHGAACVKRWNSDFPFRFFISDFQPGYGCQGWSGGL